MKIDLKPSDCCDRWKFYISWVPDKVLACHVIGADRFNSTARNRAKYAKRLGFRPHCEPWEQWNLHRDDVHWINTSAPIRQGNPMNPAYLEYPSAKTIDNPCQHHKYLLITVTLENRWYAYAIIHCMGELCNISTIIGHADYLKDGIMLLLMEEVIRSAGNVGVKVVDYGTWDSGTDGLRYFKHSTGFKPLTLTL